MKILFAVRVGDPDWKEQLITEVESRIPEAKKWAEKAGFNRIRIAEIEEGSPPNFMAELEFFKQTLNRHK